MSEDPMMVKNAGQRAEKRSGRWLKDGGYKGKCKDVYICSECGRWQTVRKGARKLIYMRYCSFCGARMEVGEAELGEG